MLLSVAVAVSIAGLVYFLFMWLSARHILSRMTSIEFAVAAMADDRLRRDKKSLRVRVEQELRRRGYESGLGPIVAVVMVSYLLTVAALRLVGVEGVAGLVISLPLVGGAGLAGFIRAGSRRRRAFNSQLSQLFTLLSGQLEAGTSLQRALPVVAASLPNPLRSELQLALRGGASTDLLRAAAELGEKYPSRAMMLFQSALQVNDDLGGGKLAGTLVQLAAIVEREKELSQEAAGTLAETRSEFVGIVVVLLGICAVSITQNAKVFLSGTGIVVLLAFGLNFAWGAWRAVRLTSDEMV